MNIGPTVMIDLNGYAHTTSGKTAFEAARNALDFFFTSYGPKPKPQDIMKISLVGDKREWRVRVGRIMQTYRCYMGVRI